MNDIYKKNVFIFDFDGTIVDSLNMFEDVDKKVIYKLTGSIVNNMYEIRCKYKKLCTKNNIDKYVCFLNNELNLNMDKELFINLRNEEINSYIKNIKLKDDVLVFINLLKALNKQTFIVTNNNILELYKKNNPSVKCFLDKMNDIIICPKEIKKPCGDIYKILLKNHNYSSEECIIFDDSKDGAIAASENAIDIINIYDKKSQKYMDSIKSITKRINYKFKDLISNELLIDNFGIILKNIRMNDTYKMIEYSLNLNNEYINSKIENNIVYILNKVARSDISSLLLILKDNYLKKLEDNFEIIKGKALPNNVIDIFNTFISDRDFMISNMESFLEIAFDDDIKNKMLNYYSNISECKNRIDNVVNSLNYGIYKHINLGTLIKISDNNLVNSINSIIDKYSEDDSELEVMYGGLTSSVFANKDYVFKIGRRRKKYNTKYSKYILQPYYRKCFEDIIIEVQDRCLNNCNEEDMEQIYSSLEKEGIYWLDKRVDNIGILLKDNYVHSDNNGIYDIKKNEVLRKGNIVLFDLDWLYTEEELKKYHDSIDEVEHECMIEIITGNNKDIIYKLFNQTYEKYRIIVNDKELLKIDSRVSLNVCENVYKIFWDDIDLDDYFSLERLVRDLNEKNVNARVKQ